MAVSAAAIGIAASWVYAARDLTLSHYDAKAHLVVARRIFDSLTPGWRQIGAIWLPLPHVLNALPVQVDAWYRTGFSAVAMSVASFTLAATALGWFVAAVMRSRVAGLSAAAVLATDPNLLYLQATPMTEPLLLGFMCLAVALVHRGIARDPDGAWTGASCTMAAACLVRYEAWPFTAALLVSSAWLTAPRHAWLASVAPRLLRRSALPLLAVVGFAVLSRATVGAWFVTGGFFVIDNRAFQRPIEAAVQVWWGTRQLAGTGTFVMGLIGLVALPIAAAWRRDLRPGLVGFSMVACGALPWYAFVHGHPFRIRYMVVLIAAVAAGVGFGIGLCPRRIRPLVAALALSVAIIEAPPFSQRAALIQEALWDRPNSMGRRAVTRCLAEGFRRPDQKILASMGSLAHYMQELSLVGFRLNDFVHEGIGELWPEALGSPSRHVDWILFEERAEGGDVLTAVRRSTPSFVDGFDRMCEGGGVALYHRVQSTHAPAR